MCLVVYVLCMSTIHLINYLIGLSSVFSLVILECRKDTSVLNLFLENHMLVLMLPSLSLLHTFQKNDHLWTLAIFYISSYSISSDSRADELLQVCVCKKSRPQLNQEGDTTPSNSSAIQKTFSAIILL